LANVKKQQTILVSAALALFIVIFFFGKTIPDKKPVPKPASTTEAAESNALSVTQLLAEARKKLTVDQVNYINELEKGVSRGDIKKQQIEANKHLASFWGDSVHQHILGAYYLGEAAKLENSEKNLNFAARLFLSDLATEENPALQKWMGLQAKALLDKSLELNPDNDSAKVGIGFCYLFGNISEAPMAGIQLIREVLQKNPHNVYAHMVLGAAGIRSGQFDKAIEHFDDILKVQPENLEAIFNLAETYDRKGDKPNAIKWYTVAKERINVPEAKKEIEARIKALQ